MSRIHLQMDRVWVARSGKFGGHFFTFVRLYLITLASNAIQHWPQRLLLSTFDRWFMFSCYSSKTPWIILSFSASLYLCWIVDSSSNDQWWCQKKENSLPFDRWSIFILNPLTQRGCSELRATPVQLEPLGTPIGSDGKNWLESKSEGVSGFKSLSANKKCKMEDADVVGFGVHEL